MLKKFVVSLLTLAFLTFGAGPVFGAPDAVKVQELKALHQQMYELRLQIIDKRVDAGLLEKEKATRIKELMERHNKQMQEDMANGKYDFGKKHGRNCDKKAKSDS
jgi:hypothetical protein